MIEFIHRHPIAIKVLLAVVTLTFILTGGWLLGKEGVTDYAAKVGKETITHDEYQNALYKMQEFYRNLYKGDMPEPVAKNLNLERRALDFLIDRKLAVLAAGKEHITVTDKELSEAITGNKSFQDETGRFNKALYLEVLKQNGMATASYEKNLRQELLAEKLKKMVRDSVYVTEGDVRDYYKKQLELQKKPFKEEEYQSKKQELVRVVAVMEQEKAVESFMAGLREHFKVEVNPRVIAGG